jgi:putative oxygen-independent coproporphyrinogen III oxidase
MMIHFGGRVKVWENGAMRGIYVHVPFCVRKCGYCDFYSVADGEEARDGFPALVEWEMDLLLRTYPGEADVPADTVYFGGGTPTALGAGRLVRLLAAIRSRFPVTDDAEITTEANPGTVTGGDFARLRKGGFNRVSLGVQSFRPETLAALGRIHSVEDVRTAYRDARKEGFASVGIDLIFGNPAQGEAEWQEDLDLAVTFLPDHVSAYALTPEPGTPLHAAIRGGGIALPDDDTVARMYTAARETLGSAGYRHYEISNFARPGKECRHNLKYWRRDGYLGLGPAVPRGGRPLRRADGEPAFAVRLCPGTGGRTPAVGVEPRVRPGRRLEGVAHLRAADGGRGVPPLHRGTERPPAGRGEGGRRNLDPIRRAAAGRGPAAAPLQVLVRFKRGASETRLNPYNRCVLRLRDSAGPSCCVFLSC